MARLDRAWKAEKEGAALATELHRVLEISHRQAKGLIDAGCVKVNGEEARAHGLRIKSGDQLLVDFDPATSYQPLPRPSRISDTPFELLWEDNDLVFVNKPAGLLTVPAEKGNEPTLADALTDSYRRRGIKRVQLYVVHRLDRWTSGVLVFAKTPEALHGLKTIFEEHHLQRVYKALLDGELPENSGTLTGRIVENPKSLRMHVVKPRAGGAQPRGTKEAVTHYRVLERLPGHTLVEVKLETGRRNQIRVQFADRGYPLLGDQVYGRTSELLDRQALHAELLGFKHPVTGDAVAISAPLPPDMDGVLKTLRLRQRITRAEAGKQGEAGIFRPRITEERKQDRIRRSKRFTENPEVEARPGRGSFGPRREGPGGEGQKRPRPAASREDRPARPGSRGGPAPDQGRPARSFGPRKEGPGGEEQRRPRPAASREDRPARPARGPRAESPDQDRPQRSFGPRKEAPGGEERKRPRPSAPFRKDPDSRPARPSGPRGSREAPESGPPRDRGIGTRGAKEEARPGGHRKPAGQPRPQGAARPGAASPRKGPRPTRAHAGPKSRKPR